MFVNLRVVDGSFLSTLSLRRATYTDLNSASGALISIHALLAESDTAGYWPVCPAPISIHALLAESDPRRKRLFHRRAISIHALLAESDIDDLIS